MSTSDIKLVALEGGVAERSYAIGDETQLPIRLKTAMRLTSEALAPFKDVPVRSVWLMGRNHTDQDVAVAAQAFDGLADFYAPVTTKLTDESIRALVPRREDFRSFGVIRSRITDEGAKLLAGFPELRVARLEHSQITDAGVAALGACRKLEQLHLEGNRGVTGSGLEAFVDHFSLKALFLSGTRVDDDGIGYLSGCTQLEDIWLSSTRVTERCLLTMPTNANLSVDLPRELDQERVDDVRRELNFTVNGVGPDHVVDVPRAQDGAPVDLPAKLRNNALTFAVFTSSSCAPCKWLKTTFDTVRPNLREQFKYVELEIEDNLQLASALHVRSVPAVFVMQFGIELDRFVGAMGVEKLTERLEEVLAL